MTSRYSLVSAPELIGDVFGLERIDPYPPRVAIAPTEPVLIVRRSLRGAREAHLVRWGLIPGWVKDPSTLSALFAARAESAAAKPSFRGGLRHRRCLVPADGFYVWSGNRDRRVAHHLARPDGRPFALGGIGDHWIGADGSELETMAVLTVAANGDVAPLAERMPVIVPTEAWDAWLDCRGGEAVAVRPLLVPPPEGLLRPTVVDGPLPRVRLARLTGA